MAFANRQQILNKFRALPEEIRWYLTDTEDLLSDDWNYDILIAYLFQKTEAARSTALYCGMRKCHTVDSKVAWNAVQKEHMTRTRFRELVNAVFGKPFSGKAVSTIKPAETVRDNIMHGKEVSEPKKREAVGRLFEYADQTNEFFHHAGGFRPFGRLQGFAGRGRTLSKATSHLVVKGLGFNLS